MNLQLPFASKQLPTGEKLKRKTYGLTFTLPASGSITVPFTIPLAWAKMNEVEVLWAPEGVKAVMNVKDNAAGTYSAIPNALLDSFGYDVNIAKDYWKGKSEYDADVYAGMILEFVIENTSSTSKTVGINIVLHQVTI
jgi:hypothetical protein